MKTTDLAAASVFGALTAVGAFIKVPIPPVPFTMQTFFLSLAGLTLGARRAALSQLVYLLLGVAGLPVFAGSIPAGPGALLGPTGGFLMGYVPAAYIIGLIAQRSERPGLPLAVATMIPGMILLYTLGTIQLANWLSTNRGTSWVDALPAAFGVAVLPFVIWDMAKILLAAYVGTRRAVLDARTRLLR